MLLFLAVYLLFYIYVIKLSLMFVSFLNRGQLGLPSLTNDGYLCGLW